MYIVVLTKDDETTRIQFAEKGIIPRVTDWAKADGYTVGMQYQMRFRPVFSDEYERAQQILQSIFSLLCPH